MKAIETAVRAVLTLSLSALILAPAQAQKIGELFGAAAHDAEAAARSTNLAREARAASEAKAAAHTAHTGTPPGKSVVLKTENRWIDGYGTAAHNAESTAKDARIATEAKPAAQKPHSEPASHNNNVHGPPSKSETRWIDSYGTTSNNSSNIHPPPQPVQRSGASDIANEAAVRRANVAQGEGRANGVAAGLNVRGNTFSDVSTGGAIRGNHPTVQRALDNVPKPLRSDYHGACAEIGCLNQAAHAGVDVSGGTMRAVKIRQTAAHASSIEACPTCKHVMNQMGIRH